MINFSSFDGKNDTERFMKATEYLENNPGTTLFVEPGSYTVTSELAVETMNKVLCGEYGSNPEHAMFQPDFPYTSGIKLENHKDTVIDAYGVTIMIDGFMEPLTVKNCQGIEIRGITIDHIRKPYSKATVIKTVYTDKASNTGYFLAEFAPEYPVCEKTPMPRLCLFSKDANRFIYYNEYEILSRRQIDKQLWRFDFSGIYAEIDGMELYAWHTFHSRPAILLENCRDIVLTDVTIHSQPGMGIVAHRDENVTVQRLRVVPSNGEHLSTNTDATHFTSCKGLVRFENCFFEGQGDDALNIHTYYHRIIRTGKNTCRIYLDAPTGTHSQSPDYPDVGDVLELTETSNLAPTDKYTVLSCTPCDIFSSELVLDKPLPENCERFFFADATRQPRLEFVNNVSYNHFARGVLVKTKNAIIEGNSFIDVVGTAIYVAAEGGWCEGVCSTESIVIRRNRIVYCGRNNDIRQEDTAGICVSVNVDEPDVADKKTHENVVITDNSVFCPHSPHAIFVNNTKRLTIERNNTVSHDDGVVIKGLKLDTFAGMV